METYESIKDRILRRAARTWGYSDSELETSFDPIVTMLLEACASELEKLASQMNNSRSRIVERLLEIMLPESNFTTYPAHAIIHATPTENNFSLSLKHQFFSKKNIPNIYNPINPIIKDIYFGPTAPFKLNTAELSFIAFHNTLYKISRNSYKDIFLKSEKHLQPGSLWLGITCPTEADQLQDLLFYVDIKNNHQKEIFFHYLKQAKLYIHGEEYPLKEGFNVSVPEVGIESIIDKNYNRLNQIYSEVNKFYAEKFKTIPKNIFLTPELLKTPSELLSLFTPDKLDALKNTLWLRIEFPEAMVTDILENVIFSLNCFPVVNKQLLTTTRKIDPYINYIPLETIDTFLDLEYITDTHNTSYHLKNFTDGNLSYGEATLRNSGVVRFDERNASELIQYLMELLKDESASFSVIGSDFVENIIKEISQLIATLEQKTKEHRFIKSNFPYVVIKPSQEIEKASGDVYTIEYWATCGEEANDMKPGSRLETHKGTDFQQNTSYLMTPSVGGKIRFSTREKILSYRASLLTHGRVVTFADIKAFCFNHFKHIITSVEIRKGTKKDLSLKQGFTRTIDILITRNIQLTPPISENEWQYLCDNLIHKLEHVSSNIYPYRLIIL